MSAGFREEGTWRQLLVSVNLWISPTLFAMKTDHLRDGDDIQFSAIVEYDHR